MSTSLHTPRSAAISALPARAGGAARRAGGATTLLAVAGVLAFVPVFVRLFETWRVSPSAARHVFVLGQRLSYPAANAGAVVVLALAGFGAIVIGRALAAVGRELRGARRLAAHLAGLSPAPHGDVLVLDDPRPQAFCAGLVAPRVYVTTGAIARLDPFALQAVLAHERHHASRHDPLRLAAHRVIAQALFFLPAVGALGRAHQLLVELGADDSALEAAGGDASGLARAMLAFSEFTSSGVEPARVDHLLGKPPSWRFPTLMCAAALLVLGLVVAVAVLAGRAAAGSATLAPPFLSAQPCVMVLAGIPGALGLAATWLSRREAAPLGRSVGDRV